MAKHNITDRQRNTMLAALRLWQHHLEGDLPDTAGLQEIASNGETSEPMSSDEIDDLCEMIN